MIKFFILPAFVFIGVFAYYTVRLGNHYVRLLGQRERNFYLDKVIDILKHENHVDNVSLIAELEIRKSGLI